MVCHYDYDREPGNEYPVAHFQINGTSDSLDTVYDRVGIPADLKSLHFPVGGKRFRPTLEELIEFLSSRVAKWWLPDAIEFVAEIPKTSVGKFDKKVIREKYRDYSLPTA